MAVSTKWYGNGLLNVAKGNIDLDGDTIHAALVGTGYTPDQDAHDFWNDVSAQEISGTGYTAGGQAITSKALTYDTSTNVVKFDFDDPTWATSTITNARYMVLYKKRGGASSADELIAYTDFGQSESSVAGAFTYQVNAGGHLTLTAA